MFCCGCLLLGLSKVAGVGARVLLFWRVILRLELVLVGWAQLVVG